MSSEPLLILSVLARGRLPGIRRTVNSAIANAGAPIIVFVFFDADKATFDAYDAPPHVHKFLLEPRHYYVRGYNAAYRTMKEAGADVIAIANNDAEFIQPNWAVGAKEQLFEAFPEGKGLLELTGDAGKCAHFVTRIPFIEEATGGWIGHPALTMYYSDRWLLDIVEDKLGRYLHISYPDNERPGWVVQHNEWEGVSAEVKPWFPIDRAAYHALKRGELNE